MTVTIRRSRLISVVHGSRRPYEIRLGADDVVYCTCRGWAASRGVKNCRHLKQFFSENPAIFSACTLDRATVPNRYVLRLNEDV